MQVQPFAELVQLLHLRVARHVNPGRCRASQILLALLRRRFRDFFKARLVVVDHRYPRRYRLTALALDQRARRRAGRVVAFYQVRHCNLPLKGHARCSSNTYNDRLPVRIGKAGLRGTKCSTYFPSDIRKRAITLMRADGLSEP